MSHAHLPRPLGHKHEDLTAFPNPARICPLKRKSSDSLAGICMKQAPGGAGDPVPAVLPGATPQPPCLRFAEGPPPTPIRPIFLATPKKPIFNRKFPRKLRQVGRCLKTSFVIKGLTNSCQWLLVSVCTLLYCFKIICVRSILKFRKTCLHATHKMAFV